MASRLLPFLVLGLAASSAAAAPAGPWTWARGAHAEVLTNGTSDQARHAAGVIEQVRTDLGLFWPEGLSRIDARPPLLLALRQGRELTDLAPRPAGRALDLEGFTQGGAARDTLVVSLQAPGDRALRHEYAHAFWNGILPAQPLWLSEGLAELTAAAHRRGGSLVFGDPVPQHVALLQQRRWIPFTTLMTAGLDAPAYAQEKLRPLYYAEAWALTRLLLSSPDGRSRLRRFTAAVSAGRSVASSMADAFGLSPDVAERRVRSSLAESHTATVPLAGNDDAVAVRVEPARDAEALTLAGDLLVRASRAADALPLLERAVLLDPTSVDALSAHARAALRLGRRADASADLDRGLALRPRDPALLLVKARTLLADASRQDQAVAALEEAVALDPTLAEACLLLADLRPHPRARRIALLETAWAAAPADTMLGVSLASLYLQRHAPALAIRTLVRAREAATNADLRFLADHLIGRIGEVAQGTRPVSGTLKALDCPEGGALDFVIEEEGQLVRLRAPTPNAVFLYDEDGEQSARTLTCGAQDVVVSGWGRFLHLEGAPEVDGLLLSLDVPGRQGS